MPLIGLLLLLMVQPHDLVGKHITAVQQEIQQGLAERMTESRLEGAEQFFATYAVTGSAQKLLFMLALSSTLLGVFAAAYEIVGEEAIYRRERMVNLRLGAYIFSKLTVLGIFALVQAYLLLTVVGIKVRYPELGVFQPAFLEMYITLFLTIIAGIAMGLAISAAVRGGGTVIYVILLVIFLQIIFAGAIFELPRSVRPISYLTTTRWALEALGNTVNMESLQNRDVTCVAFEDDRMERMFSSTQEPCRQGQMKQHTDYTFNVDYSHTTSHLLIRWMVLIGFIVGFVAITYMLQQRKDILGNGRHG